MKRFLPVILIGVFACATAPRPVGPALCATLDGAGPGSDATDPLHHGTVRLFLTRAQIRYEISAAGLGTPIATHIHHGEQGVNGPMLWELNPGYTGDSVRATTSEIPPGLIRLIAADPSDYYVKIHTAEFPGGAIRGQLIPCGSLPAQTSTSKR